MSTDRIEIHASPDGSPYADGSPGYPVDGLHSAMKLVRRLRRPGQRAVVWLRSGEYRQSETLVLGPADSFTTFAALDATDQPVISGAEPVTAWRELELAGARVFAAAAPRDRGRALYVDGQRAPRPRFPSEGLLRIAEQDGLDPTASFVGTLFNGADRFRFAPGSIPELSNPRLVEAVVPHYWVQERMPIVSIDYEECEIVSDRRSIFALRDDAGEGFAQFYLENVAESFGATPGEWYLDPSGERAGATTPQVLYVPRDGETAAGLEIRMPVLDVFIEAAGTATEPIREIRLENLRFSWADFAEAPIAIPPFGVREDPMLDPDGRYAAEVQASNTVPGAISFRFARSCAVIDGAVERVGGYGITLAEGCRGNLISGIRFHDLGAGAVRSGGSADASSPAFNSRNEVTDCEISRGGRTYPSCVGILFEHGSHNVIAHNEISDLFYTGISVGWEWGYHDSPSQGNRIEANHIHHLGQGVLNDMGGIYLLGIAPGTVVRGNHIHDIRCANYGGWGIYLDEGSSHVVVEQNVVHDASSNAYHQHYGREVIIRNNVFAFGGHGQVTLGRPEEHVSFTFERNVVVGNHSPGFVGQQPRGLAGYRVYSDLNLFWDIDPLPGAMRAADGRQRPLDGGGVTFEVTTPLDEEWGAWGHDRHSVTADPGFRDIAARDFRFGKDSPAVELGILPPEVSRTGPRPEPERRHPLRPLTLPDQFAPTEAVNLL